LGKHFLLFFTLLVTGLNEEGFFFHTACCLNSLAGFLKWGLIEKLKLRQLVTTEARETFVGELEQVFLFSLPFIVLPLLHSHLSLGTGTLGPSGAAVARG
jgi:hypothetical protein